MLSQKLSRIGFKMTDMEEYEQMKRRRGDKAMDTTPEAESNSFSHPPPKKSQPPTSNMSTPGGASLRSSTPEQAS